METITLDFKNYEQISLCCCDEISEPIKKKWLQNHMQDGVVYRRSAEDASFMEYMPGEDAWCPVEAPQVMFIHFFHVDQNAKAAKTLMRIVASKAAKDWQQWYPNLPVRYCRKRNSCILLGSNPAINGGSINSIICRWKKMQNHLAS